jgi:hypothetical protein
MLVWILVKSLDLTMSERKRFFLSGNTARLMWWKSICPTGLSYCGLCYRTSCIRFHSFYVIGVSAFWNHRKSNHLQTHTKMFCGYVTANTCVSSFLKRNPTEIPNLHWHERSIVHSLLHTFLWSSGMWHRVYRVFSVQNRSFGILVWLGPTSFIDIYNHSQFKTHAVFYELIKCQDLKMLCEIKDIKSMKFVFNKTQLL